MGHTDSLDFAIMCEGTIFSNWMADCIESLVQMENVNLVLLITEDNIDEDRGKSSSGLSSKISTFNRYRKRTSTKEAIDFATFFYYKKLTGASIGPNEALQTRDLSDILGDVDTIECSVEEDGFSQYFNDEDIDEIRSYNIDFILRNAFGIIRGEILEVPTYGIWSFHHQNEQKYRGSPPGLWEIIEGDPVTGAILQRLTNRLDGGIVLRRGFFETKRDWSENINHVFYGTVEWPAQVARDILQGNSEYVNGPPSSTDAPIYRNPSLYDLTKYHLNDLRSKLRQLKKGRDNWNIGIIESDVQDLVGNDTNLGVTWFPKKRNDGFFADPFVAEIDGGKYIFAENYSYEREKGVISYIKYPDDFKNGEFHHAYEEDIHMSYPYMFTHDNNVYCTPEIHESNEVKLYRIERPDKWITETTLVDGIQAVEPTVIHHGDYWWLFFMRSENLYDSERYQHTKLFLYYSSNLFHGWEPHYNNPVKTDIRSSRPAGSPFRMRGDLFRPTQYCVGEYGKKITLNKITELNPDSFNEEIIGEITPTNPYPKGTHHLSTGDKITAIDGKRHIWDREIVKRKCRNIYSHVFD